MKNPFRKLRTNRLSTTIILMVEVVLILSSCIFCTVSILNSRSAIRTSIQQRMLDIANCAAGSVDGDILETLTAEDAGTPEYQAIYDALAVYRDNVELKYVYGIKDEGGGRFTFTVDPALDDPGEFGQEIKTTEALLTASTGTAAVDQVPYTDAWGDFYSAYSPVFDSSGKVAGIIAADFSVSWFESQLSAQTRSTVISYCVILLATLLAAALLSLIVVSPFVRRQEQLSLEVTRKADENEQLILQIVRSLADAVDAKDPYSSGHSRRVSRYSEKLAEALGWEKERIDGLRYAALLHDIGKIGIPDSILHSPRSLTEAEYGIIKTHSTLGGDILKNRIMNKTAETVARCHHERYDGTGYPLGLRGEEISEEARIVAIADAFDAMRSDRAYRKACDAAYIRRELTEEKGKQFDPELADVFLKLWDQGLLDHIEEKEPEEENESIDKTSALLQEVVEAFVAQNAAEDIDIITGVLNRTAGEALIAQTMQAESGCFVLFDVDDLKKVNDTWGHEAGDRVLRLVGEVLTENSEDSLCCRLGGDEFLLFRKGGSREDAEACVQTILDTFETRKKEDPQIVAASLSAGLAMSTPAESYLKIYTNADKALYHVKQNGKSDYSLYNRDPEAAQGEKLDAGKLLNSIHNSGSYKGALDVEYRQFTKLYEYISNLEKRYSHPFNLILISLDAAEGEGMKELERDMFYMEQSIRQTIRTVDIITRYSKQQFLVILFGADHAGVVVAVDRIFRGYYHMNGSCVYVPSYFIVEMDGNLQQGEEKEDP